jgi:hypothetical protein
LKNYKKKILTIYKNLKIYYVFIRNDDSNGNFLIKMTPNYQQQFSRFTKHILKLLIILNKIQIILLNIIHHLIIKVIWHQTIILLKATLI